jgi:CrcB protein
MRSIGFVLAVAIGGALGSLGRWALAAGLQRLSGTWSFPLGTLAANFIGCFAIGLCYVWLVERAGSAALRMGVMTGVLGALTTFSTYGLESVMLLEQRRYGPAVVNVLGSVALGLAAVIAGMAVARRF